MGSDAGVAIEQTPWQSLHPLSVAVNLLPRTWAFLRRSWLLVVALLYGRTGTDTMIDVIDIGILALFFMGTIGSTIVHFLTLRYRIHDGRLELRSGLLNRQARVFRPDRIQNMELVRNVFHRMSGLVEVRIETASGSEVEGLLSALSEDDAQELIDALDAARSHRLQGEELTDESQWPVVVETSLSDLVWYGVTGARLGSMVVLFGVLFQLLTYDDPQRLEQLSGLVGMAGGGLLLVATMSGAWVVSVVNAVVRHWGFRLRQKADGLVAEQGLFTNRRIELKRRKVQIVRLLEPAVRRLLLNVASIQVETAAVRESGDGTDRSVALVPVVPDAQVDAVLAKVLPTGTTRLAGLQLRPPADKALIRGLIGAGWRSVLLVAFLLWLLGSWGLPVIVWVPLSLTLAWLDHRHQGWAVTDDLVVARSGWLHRRTELLARTKLQSVERTQGPLLRRYGLGRVRVRVAGDAVDLPLIRWDEAAAIQELLLEGARRPPPRAPGPEVAASDEVSHGVTDQPVAEGVGEE